MVPTPVIALLLCALVVHAAPPARTDTIVTAANDDDWQPPNVYTTLSIGSPGVSFKLQMDQYFEDAMLKGPQCTSLSCKGPNGNRTTYNPKSSTTSKDQGDAAKLHYGTTVTGEYYTDNVQVNGISDTDVAFAILSIASQKFYKVAVDGVFGLSFLGNTRGKKNLPSPVNSILKNASRKIVSLWFNRATSNDNRYGTVTFGKIPTDNCSSTVQYSLVTDDDFTFKVQKIRFSNFVAHREMTAKIDPSSNSIGLPTTIYKDFLRVATGSTSNDYVTCTTIKDITLDIKIGGVYYSLKTEDFTYKYGSTYCKFLIIDNNDDFDTGFVLGEPFFRRFCITYDVENKQIGFSDTK